jgi:hypothetical protein
MSTHAGPQDVRPLAQVVTLHAPALHVPAPPAVVVHAVPSGWAVVVQPHVVGSKRLTAHASIAGHVGRVPAMHVPA